MHRRQGRPLRLTYCRHRGALDHPWSTDHQDYTYWDEELTSSQSYPLRISHGGLKVTVLKQDGTNERVMPLSTDEAILPSNGIEYFEVKVFTKARDRPATVSIGVGNRSEISSELPGLVVGSYGYQGADGSFQYRGLTAAVSGSIPNYGPPVRHEDTIGCGVNFVSNELFFTRNGVNLGVAYKGKLGGRWPLFFVIGIQAPQVEYVLANFGNSPFMFDLENLWKKTKSAVVAKIDCKKPPSYPESGYVDFNQIVLGYLQDNGYVSTAEAFARAASIDTDFLKETEYRSVIRKYIVKGEMSTAVNLVDHRYPELFKSRQPLLFRLRIQEFVDRLMSLRENLINSMETDDSTFTVEMLNKDFTSLHKLGCQISRLHSDLVEKALDDQKLTKRMKQAFALLAYNNPEDSPFKNLVSPTARHKMWEDIKGAIIEYTGRSKFNVLQTLVAHNASLMKIMIQEGLGAPAFVDRYVFEN